MFRYARPVSLDDALSVLGDEPEARPLCGGTDLLVGLRKGTVRVALVVDLKGVPELGAGIEVRGEVVRIAATTPLTMLSHDERIQAWFPALVEAARVVGSIQIRNRATLAGNLVNASPAADTVPPLLVHQAGVEMAGPAGRRTEPLAGFLVGPGRTTLAPGEIVTAVSLPLPSGPTGDAFGRMTRRRGVDLATVNLACAISDDGTTRFAFGAVGPRAYVVTDESGTLADPDANAASRDAILERMTAEATPISNVRASRQYRARMLRVLADRALAAARSRLESARHAG